MPVTARLSKHFYDRLGEQVANELVEWFNQVDAQYRNDLRDLNEQNFARFDAKVEQRFAEQDARIERRFAESEVKFEKRFAEFEVKIERRLAGCRVRQGVHGGRSDRRAVAAVPRCDRDAYVRDPSDLRCSGDARVVARAILRDHGRHDPAESGAEDDA